MLAVAAQVVGMLICMQDQTTVTPDQAMEMVMKNIVIGNETAMADVLSAGGTPQ